MERKSSLSESQITVLGLHGRNTQKLKRKAGIMGNAGPRYPGDSSTGPGDVIVPERACGRHQERPRAGQLGKWAH